ncbi:NOS1 [Cordylochernes scorpioides]|uniref:Nitric oxide synthase n=1 Tax=Cordylochernes scorpioides TaxID=51811 RepID=A0ABY6KU67_9ARAC|nr:NOS1 [Cordylochernes scorpioides]
MASHVLLRHVGPEELISDTLHKTAKTPGYCTTTCCQGALMNNLSNKPTKTKEDALREAEDFYKEYFTSIKRLNSEAHQKRWEEVRQSIEKTRTYEQTENELSYGTRLAWRNASRCIGRIQWSKRLQLFDGRKATTTKEMFDLLCAHLRYATNEGNIRSAISVFPPRLPGRGDYRVWNGQLLSFAGYRQEDGSVLGDPNNVEITSIALRIGWKPPRSRFDVLPWILQIPGEDPDFYEIPEDLVMFVHFEHPRYEWFKDLGLKWYAVPAVANMLLDCGGIEYTACPFNGWYMSTEIGARNLCDSSRLNILPKIKDKICSELADPNTPLWRDRALVEVNIAVLHSFQKAKVTIMDHHTASDSFMKHFKTEQKLRGGCPGDWVWIVPPISGSITPVFHQEMLNYFLKPSYEYQERASKRHVWKSSSGSNTSQNGEDKGQLKKPKTQFQNVLRLVKLTANMYTQILAQRFKVTILYATETGKSEQFANDLADIFDYAFNAKVVPMQEYDFAELPFETLVLVVTSTFGNGDPPENGESFAHYLKDMNASGDVPDKIVQERKPATFVRRSLRLEGGLRSQSSQEEQMTEVGLPLTNIRFGVFGLGSSAYPNFCAFGAFVDEMLGNLGAQRLSDLEKGDEMCGQEMAFKLWARKIFKAACKEFNIEEYILKSPEVKLDKPRRWEKNHVKLVDEKKSAPLLEGEDSLLGVTDRQTDKLGTGLKQGTPRKLCVCVVKHRESLHPEKKGFKTIRVELKTDGQPDLKYVPGDHVGVYPENQAELVDGILKFLPAGVADKPVRVQILKGKEPEVWAPLKWLPACTIKEALTHYLDITSVPQAQFLGLLASCASDPEDASRLTQLCEDAEQYEQWKTHHQPHLLEVLQQFSSLKPNPELLFTGLPQLQPRFYSISSCGASEIHATVAVVSYQTQDGKGPTHYGVCSSYLARVPVGSKLVCFTRTAANFHLPADPKVPVILIGPGTGIAPFRSFWRQRSKDMDDKGKDEFGPMTLFMGYRTPEVELYTKETDQMKQKGVLTNIFKAYSRLPNQPKCYVQDLMKQNSYLLHNQLIKEHGHLYVCGDIKMAADVQETLKILFMKRGSKSMSVQFLETEGRYHEDIFGITLRTAEVTSKVKEEAFKTNRNSVLMQQRPEP